VKDDGKGGRNDLTGIREEFSANMRKKDLNMSYETIRRRLLE